VFDRSATKALTVAFGRSRTPSFQDAALWFLGQARQSSLTVPRFSDVARFLTGTQRVAVMHRRFAVAEAARYDLTMCEVPYPLPPFEVVVMYRSSRKSDAAFMWLLGIIRRLGLALTRTE
jgi:LysR family nod box-dependent transcriptional activator